MTYAGHGALRLMPTFSLFANIDNENRTAFQPALITQNGCSGGHMYAPYVGFEERLIEIIRPVFIMSTPHNAT